MAVDTRQKRFSMLSFGDGVILHVLFEADATAVDLDDRQHLLGCYSGIPFGEPAEEVVPEVVVTGGYAGKKRRKKKRYYYVLPDGRAISTDRPWEPPTDAPGRQPITEEQAEALPEPVAFFEVEGAEPFGKFPAALPAQGQPEALSKTPKAPSRAVLEAESARQAEAAAAQVLAMANEEELLITLMAGEL